VPLPEAQVALSDHRGWIGTVDFAWRDQRLVVETDGREFHDSLTDRENDERRDRELEAVGWTVLRFNWNDVTKRPTSVVRTVMRALAIAA
jgi:very-short-patch-repair endonuclease